MIDHSKKTDEEFSQMKLDMKKSFKNRWLLIKQRFECMVGVFIFSFVWFFLAFQLVINFPNFNGWPLVISYLVPFLFVFYLSFKHKRFLLYFVYIALALLALNANVFLKAHFSCEYFHLFDRETYDCSVDYKKILHDLKQNSDSLTE